LFLVLSLLGREEEKKEPERPKKQIQAKQASQTYSSGFFKEPEKKAKIGYNGKYYCGGKLETKCDCCNGKCGLDIGCNCSACMKLDIIFSELIMH